MAAVLLSTFFFADSLGCMASEFLLIYFLGVSQLYGCSSFYCFSLLTLLALWPQSIKSLIFFVDDSWLYGRSVKCTFSLKSFLAVLSSFFSLFTLLALWPQSTNVLFLHCRRLVALLPQFFCLLFSLLTLLAVWPRSFFLIYFLGISQLYGCSSFYCFSLLTLLALWPQSIKSLIFLVDDSWLYGRSVKCTFSLKSFLAVLSSFFSLFTLLALWPQSTNVWYLHCRRLVALWPQFFCLLCSLLTLLAVWPQSFLFLLFINLVAIWRICFFSFIAFLCLLSWPFKPSNSRFHCKRLVAWASVLHSCTFLLLLAV